LLGEPGFVVVETHVAVVHRQGAMLGIDLQVVGNRVQDRRRIGLEDAGVQRPAEQGVIHPVEDVGQRVIFAEDRLVEHHARVAGFENLDLGVVLRLEGGDDLLADVEAVVAHHPYLARLKQRAGR
jgi:hypothetical protein